MAITQTITINLKTSQSGNEKRVCNELNEWPGQELYCGDLVFLFPFSL